MRNNQDRLAGHADAGQEPPAQQIGQPPQQTEQPLQFVTPTEIIELPSRGNFYPDGHPLCGAETIEIRHMTAKDEDILTSRSLLKKGIAIDRFLQNIIIDKSIKVTDLLVGDKNAIIVAARISGYGANYEASVVCPACSTAKDFGFDLNICEVIPWDTYKYCDVRLTPNNTFIIHVDKLDVDVEVRLLVGRDETALTQLAEKRRKNKLPESNLTDQLRSMIVSVDGNPQHNYIESFIQAMPASDSRKLRATYQKIIPNIDMVQGYVCSECDFEGEVNVPFGTNFFWPKQ